MVTPAIVVSVPKFHHALLLVGQEPRGGGGFGEDEIKDRHHQEGHGPFYAKQPTPARKPVRAVDLRQAKGENAAEGTGESAEGKNQGGSLASLGFLVHPA